MSTTLPVAQTLKAFLPALQLPASADLDPVAASQALFPDAHYSDGEKVEIRQWAAAAAHLAAPADEDAAKRVERLGALNGHLATRATLAGSKPSAADVLVYARLAPAVRAWSAEERTGERGYHHIVRHLDFVEHAPLFGLQVAETDQVGVDPDHVLFVPKPVDPKEEKERRRKEKAAAAAAAQGSGEATLVTIRTKDAATLAGAPEGAAAPGKAKKEKKEKAPKPAKQPAPAKDIPLSPALIDLRVGHILKAEAHPNADSLYVSTIAVGDPAGADNTTEYEGQVVRTVCSGLNGLVPLAEMQGRRVVAVCNLKPVTMRGVKSAAMVLAASPRPAPGAPEAGHAKETVELVDPPVGAAAGARVAFEGWEGEPESVLNPKRKVWETCQAGFTTTDDRGVAFERAKVEQLQDAPDRPELARLVVKGVGPCTVKSLQGATVR